MSSKKTPLVVRVADELRKAHARSPGGVHAGAAGGGCDICALLREAASVGLLSGPWPSSIAWDGRYLNGAVNGEATSTARSEGEGGVPGSGEGISDLSEV